MKSPIILGLTSIVLAGTMMNAEAITIAHGGDSVDIDFVDIGNAGNAADTADGFLALSGIQNYGSVSYDYSIGKFEVTADQWAAVTGFDALIENYNTDPFSYDPWSGSQPTANTSWYEAAKFANWLTSGNALQGAYTYSGTSGTLGTFTGVDRATALTTYGTIYVLPSDDEWYKAAYLKSDGSGYTTYATGDSLPVAGTDANYDRGGPSSPWDVGSGTEENNGTFDMGGNVFEWNESQFDENFIPDMRALRGGFGDGDSSFLRSSYRNGLMPDLETDAHGFRVAALGLVAVPEPSSVGLLVIGAMGCVLRRKRG